jgi:serine/threonine-protein kinase
MRENAEPEPDTKTLRPQAPPALPQKPAPPQKIDRYELQALIGRGGMGAVYRALDTRLGRLVALKTATAKRSGARLTDRVRQRFLREAMALSRVEHRNVVQVLDFGFADEGTPFLVMELLRGRDLGALLAETQRPLGITEAVDVMLGVCAALRACHRAGIIHRDLKPGNIFLAETETGREVKVLDFGVSKAPTDDDLTREGQILGTPQYLAPEQVDGKVGPASDQYALGVLLYVSLTLRLPYEEHQDGGLLRAIEAGRFAPPRKFRAEIPEALEAIVLRAMHTSPSERFESVFALGQRLWDLASPRSQEEWRGYYFPGRREAAGVPFLARTMILEPAADDAPAVESAFFARSTSGEPAQPAATSARERSTPLELPASLRSSRRPLALAALGALVLAAAFIWVRGHATARTNPGVGTTTAARSVEPPSVGRSSPPAPPAPAQHSSPSVGPEVTSTSAHLAAAPTEPPREAPPEPLAPDTTGVPRKRPTSRLRRPDPLRRRPPPAPQTFPNLDQFGIGIPSE